ncbi:zinc finger protein OZF-like protein [Leptotrombidium deliense]|uniref:Zinc finger protein OZF-like protein n=1 Tax=Leptotrombidium deliense TaxID=299467 RepID=A0A443RY07_9ACAR|nr:zinc finger protein OZF-like protein [Leptotrombidium deliense]
MVLVKPSENPNNSRKISFWSSDKTIDKFSYIVCNKTFGRKSAVLKHIETVHNGEKRFSCAYCDKRFANKNSALEHIEAIHKQINSYACVSCGQSFFRKRYLHLHLKHKHAQQTQQSASPSLSNENVWCCIMCWKPLVSDNCGCVMCSNLPSTINGVNYQNYNERHSKQSRVTHMPSVQADNAKEKYKLLAVKYKLKECKVPLNRLLPSVIDEYCSSKNSVSM